MNATKYQVKTIAALAELDRVYSFAVSVLGEMDETVHTLDYYRRQVDLTPTLLVCTESLGKLIGCVLGSIEQNHILVGPTAVAEEERRLGVGSAMMRRMEEEARKIGQTTLILGARQEAEDFYIHCGYRSNLFIQLPGIGQASQLKQLNRQYSVIWESEDGEWTRLMLATPRVDRELQAIYEKQFPGCSTQYVFIKEIG